MPPAPRLTRTHVPPRAKRWVWGLCGPGCLLRALAVFQLTMLGTVDPFLPDVLPSPAGVWTTPLIVPGQCYPSLVHLRLHVLAPSPVGCPLAPGFRRRGFGAHLVPHRWSGFRSDGPSLAAGPGTHGGARYCQVRLLSSRLRPSIFLGGWAVSLGQQIGNPGKLVVSDPSTTAHPQKVPGVGGRCPRGRVAMN